MYCVLQYNTHISDEQHRRATTSCLLLMSLSLAGQKGQRTYKYTNTHISQRRRQHVPIHHIICELYISNTCNTCTPIWHLYIYMNTRCTHTRSSDTHTQCMGTNNTYSGAMAQIALCLSHRHTSSSHNPVRYVRTHTAKLHTSSRSSQFYQRVRVCLCVFCMPTTQLLWNECDATVAAKAIRYWYYVHCTCISNVFVCCKYG